MLKLWGPTSFSECAKFYVDSKKALKYQQKVFGF